MDYSILQLARLAGISTRTLRYYDQLGLLKPARISGGGYRIYNSASVDRLLLILLYRELDFNLEAIKNLLNQPLLDAKHHLESQHSLLLKKRETIDQRLDMINRNLLLLNRGETMTDQAKFENQKNQMISTNEQKYGQEIRQKYGNQTVDNSNARLKGMDQTTFDHANELAALIIEKLLQAMDSGDPASDLAQETVQLHKEWLMIYWPAYTPEAHAGLAQMYVDDERFTSYYDQHREGAALFLRDAILHVKSGLT